jgi:hypothetical protein
MALLSPGVNLADVKPRCLLRRIPRIGDRERASCQKDAGDLSLRMSGLNDGL